MKEIEASWSFILVAAGSGSRMGGTPKQFRSLGGQPLWLWSAQTAEELCAQGLLSELVVVFPSDYDLNSAEIGLSCPVKYVRGGETRSDSVRNGLLAASSEYVMIHDAARPFLNRDICLQLMQQTKGERGAVPLLPSVDSLKRVVGDSVSTVSRDDIFRTQTPQAFERARILDVLSSSDSATDEGTLWLASGLELVQVPGDERNFKITTEFDWLVARSLAEERREIRTGIGYDVHELVPGRRLVLGGIEIPFCMGLLGHSDADIICHTASDALLGAAGEGDIGTLFPASDDKYKDADSVSLMREVLELLKSKGWRVTWLDIALTAQLPRLGKEIPKILDNFNRQFYVYGLDKRVSLKVKSGELTGSVGRAQSMVCYAVASIERYCI